MAQGGYQVIIILPIKSKMAATRRRCFLRFLYFTESFFFSKLAKEVNRVSKIRVCMCLRYVLKEFFVTFPWYVENVKSRSKIAFFFQMSAILKFDFQKREQLRFSEVNYLNYTKKDPILHVATTIFPKTRGNKNKPWTHFTPLKEGLYTSFK